MKKSLSLLATLSLLASCGNSGKVDVTKLIAEQNAAMTGQRSSFVDTTETKRTSVLVDGAYLNCEYKKTKMTQTTLEVNNGQALILFEEFLSAPNSENPKECPATGLQSFLKTSSVKTESLEDQAQQAIKDCAVPGECSITRATRNGEAVIDFNIVTKEDGILIKSTGTSVLNNESPWLTPAKSINMVITSYETGEEIQKIEQSFDLSKVQIENTKKETFETLLEVKPESLQVEGKKYSFEKEGENLVIDTFKYEQDLKDEDNKDIKCAFVNKEMATKSFGLEGHQAVVINNSTMIDSEATPAELIDACTKAGSDIIRNFNLPKVLKIKKNKNKLKIDMRVNGKFVPFFKS
ncbi:MAG: hypothetical protein GY909_03775 [Oligoflexia bacterium]|nr:hypothetical protein [Oligoflexia bacterium]